MMKIQLTDEMSNKISNMSFLCAVFVAIIHSQAPGLWGDFLKEGICRVAVPFFFIVSGYFLSRHFNDDSWYIRELKKRVFSLIVPCVIWSFVTLLAMVPIELIVSKLIIHRPFDTSLLFPSGGWVRFWGLDLTDFPYVVPFWYIRCLFLYVIVAPIIAMGVKKFKVFWLIGCFCLMFAYFLARVDDKLIMICKMLGMENGIFYFSLGIWLNGEHYAVTRKQAMLGGIVGILFLVAKVVLPPWFHGFYGILKTLAIPFLLLFIWYFIPVRPLPRWMKGGSFAIYLMHIFLFHYVDYVYLKAHLISGIWVVKCVFGVCGALMIALLARRVSPLVAKVLLGGR